MRAFRQGGSFSCEGGAALESLAFSKIRVKKLSEKTELRLGGVKELRMSLKEIRRAGPFQPASQTSFGFRR